MNDPNPPQPQPQNGPTPNAPRPPMNPQAVAAPPPPPPGYVPMYGPPPKAKGWVSRVLTSLLVSVVILSVVLNVYLAVLVYKLTAGLQEDVLQEGTTTQRVVILPVVGGIDDTMSRFVRSALRQFESNPPAAIVLRVESGGGGVTASDQIWDGLERFKDKHPDVPVVASFGGVAASGGYYIAAGSNHIVCEPTGFTGSIGVIAQVPTLAGTMRMLGVDWVTQVADGSPLKDDANNMFRHWDDEDRAVLAYLINNAYDRFATVVKDGRQPITDDNVGDVATGAIFTAADAKDNGLVDSVGYLQDAIDEAATLAGLPTGDETRVTIVRQPTGFGLLGVLGRRSVETPHELNPQALTADGLRTFLEDFSEVRLSYRWAPGGP